MDRSLYFDFDRTFIDADALKALQAQKVADLAGVSTEQIEEVHIQYISTLQNSYEFFIDDYIKLLCQKLNIRAKALEAIYFTDTGYITDFVYPDVIPTLRKLKTKDIKMGIFSEAHPKHQWIKLEKSGVLEYIERENVIIATHKVQPDQIAKVPRDAIMIDDSLRVIDSMLTAAPHLQYIWLNRKNKDLHPKVTTIF